GQIHEPPDELVVEGGELLLLRESVDVISRVPDDAMMVDAPHPLNAVAEDGNERVQEGATLDRPEVVARHDLVLGIPFLGAADEELARDFGDSNHESGLAEVPFLGP